MEQSKRINGIYLKADTINGVYEICSEEITNNDVVTTPKLFQACLSTLDDGESQIAFFSGDSEDIYDAINSEYGIR